MTSDNRRKTQFQPCFAESLDDFRYVVMQPRGQVRIVNDEQKQQIEDVVAYNAKQLADYNSRKAELDGQLLATYDVAGPVRRIKDPERNAELKKAISALRETYRPTSLPTDIRYAQFSTISDVGSDYVGFDRSGVETFHRLSSILLIVRGVEMDGE